MKKYLGITIAGMAFCWPSVQAEEEDNQAPTIQAQQEAIIDITGKQDSNEVATFKAIGGKTVAPPDDRGCPPWTKTGAKRYIWFIRTIDGDDLDTDPQNGDESTSDTLTVKPTKAGKIAISVFFQEEYEDSSEGEPQRLYWPENTSSE